MGKLGKLSQAKLDEVYFFGSDAIWFLLSGGVRKSIAFKVEKIKLELNAFYVTYLAIVDCNKSQIKPTRCCYNQVLLYH
jgi:hypothetical protein